MNSVDSSTVCSTIVDGIPVAYSVPGGRSTNGRLALWLPHLGGTKETYADVLQRLSASGFLAVSLDPWQHGERATESNSELMAEVFGGFRRRMWPILGQTTLDACRVIDWAMAAFGLTGDVVAGGVSMGADIAVALAGIDSRVTRVAAMVATPDWARPGMTQVDDPEVVLDQGSPTASGQWLYAHLDPMSNRSAYAHAPAISFELGSLDTHVAPAGATAFLTALTAEYPMAAKGITINLNDGLDHLGVCRSPEVQDRALRWLVRE